MAAAARAGTSWFTAEQLSWKVRLLGFLPTATGRQHRDQIKAVGDAADQLCQEHGLSYRTAGSVREYRLPESVQEPAQAETVQRPCHRRASRAADAGTERPRA